jgi:hypothetical protein
LPCITVNWVKAFVHLYLQKHSLFPSFGCQLAMFFKIFNNRFCDHYM